MTEIPPRFSLLFANPNTVPEEIYDQQTIDFIGPLPAEEGARPTVEKILRLRTTRKDVLYRREILEDFLQYPTLLTKCEQICHRWEELERIAKREVETNGETTYGQAIFALKETTVSLMEHLRFLRRSADEMEEETPDSSGLFAFAQYLRRHADSEAIQSLTEQIGNYPLLREQAARGILQINLDKNGAATCADLVYFGKDEGKYLRKNSSRREEFTADLPKENTEPLTTHALCRLTETFRRITETIREAFLPLKEGIIFYQTALSVLDWARKQGYPCTFPDPVAESGPVCTAVRDLREMNDGIPRPAVSLTARPLEVYSGQWGTETLRTIARTQILASAGFPVVGEDPIFCPDETVVLYDSEAKTVNSEIEALAKIFHKAKKHDIILLNQPLITVGNAPAAEIVNNLLRAFHKKGACVRLATDLPLG